MPSVSYLISRKRDRAYEDLNIVFNNNILEIPHIALTTNDSTIYTKSLKYAVNAYTSRLGNPELKYLKNRGDDIPTYTYKWYTEKQLLYMIATNAPQNISGSSHNCQDTITIQIIDRKTQIGNSMRLS